MPKSRVNPKQVSFPFAAPDVPPANAVSPTPKLQLVYDETVRGHFGPPGYADSGSDATLATLADPATVHHPEVALETSYCPEHDHPKPCPGCAFNAGPWEVDEAPAVFDTSVFHDPPDNPPRDDPSDDSSPKKWPRLKFIE